MRKGTKILTKAGKIFQIHKYLYHLISSFSKKIKRFPQKGENVHKLFFYHATNKTKLEENGRLSGILVILCAVSILTAAATGNAAAAGNAVLEGAKGAVELSLELAGPLCFWCAVTQLLERAGAAAALARCLRTPLRLLFPLGTADGETRAALAENVSANLLGLGNAATPAGIRAAKGMARLGLRDELCLLVVLNTASLQLLPTTAASLRAALGAAAPFDITPAVWLSSALSVTAGLGAAALLRRIWPA